MTAAAPAFVSFAPGRVCLFGEHQDYLGLPVIAAAVPLGCRMVVEPRTDGVWTVCTPQLDFTWSCTAGDASRLAPESQPDASAFLRAGLQEALEAGWNVEGGGTVMCSVDLPLQAGLSSSSAMVVAWMQALARVADVALTPHELARWAHKVEVAHFGEPGGHMDHVASALGGIHRIHPDWRAEPLDVPSEGVWIVVDSGEPKDTRGHLHRCKIRRLALLENRGRSWVDPDVLDGFSDWPAEDQTLWQATWRNMQLEARAAAHWEGADRLATWMSAHHSALRDGLGLSTPRLESLGEAAMEAGAWGWKVVGSGGGGCALVWCPEHAAREVHQALRNAGARASWTLPVAQGAHCMPWKRPKNPAVVLAAGRSSRMKQAAELMDEHWSEEERAVLTQRPKAMLPVEASGRPFLALLLERLLREGVDHVCVVRSCEDQGMPNELEPWIPKGLTLDFVHQTLPPGANKPLGTADAVQRGLEAHPEWEGLSVAVFNGDNLPPEGAVALLHQTPQGVVAFARSALGLPEGRERAFAVFEGTPQTGVVRLIEKPSEEEVHRVADEEGEVWVSMNVFRLRYKAFLEGCRRAPLHPERRERELPHAAMLAAEREGKPLEWVSFRGAFLDMTHPRDWRHIRQTIYDVKHDVK